MPFGKIGSEVCDETVGSAQQRAPAEPNGTNSSIASVGIMRGSPTRGGLQSSSLQHTQVASKSTMMCESSLAQNPIRRHERVIDGRFHTLAEISYHLADACCMLEALTRSSTGDENFRIAHSAHDELLIAGHC